MSISVNGQSVVPPGFRFHPTEEELLTYYLNKKVASERIDLDVIRDVDLNKLEPWDIQERCRIGTGPQSDWYFFSHKDKKYPTGTRTNRATAAGFWKATGRDKAIYSSASAVSARIGMRKTLVFYKGRAPHGHKSDWIMHEYRLHDPSGAGPGAAASSSSPIRGVAGVVDQSAVQEEGWVICRVFKKKNLVHQSGAGGGAVAAAAAAGHAAQAANDNKLLVAGGMESSPSNCSTVTTVAGGDHATKAQEATVQQMMHHYSSAANDDALDHILQYMGRSSGDCKQETATTRKQPNSAAAAAAATLVDHHHHLILANAATTIGGACLPNAASAALYGKFMKLPPLEHVVTGGGLLPAASDPYGTAACTVDASAGGGIADWDTLDRLAAYELNGLTDGAASRNSSIMAGFFDDHVVNAGAFSSSVHASSAAAGDGDLWSLARSVSSLHADLTMNN